MHKKNILIINQEATIPQYGYVHHRHYFIAQELLKYDYNVTIVASNFSHFFQTFPPNNKYFNFENHNGVQFCWVRGLKYENPNGLLRLMAWFIFCFNLFFLPFRRIPKPDIILVSSTSMLPFINGYLIKKIFKSKIIYEIRDVYPLTLQELGRKSKFHPAIILLGQLEKLIYRKSDYLTGTLPALEQHIKYVVKKNVVKYKCIPQGYNEDNINDNEQLPEDFFDKYSIYKDQFLIGYAGTIGTSNAIEPIIDAIKIINQKGNIKVRLALLGDGKTKKTLIKYADNDNNISFLPRVDKKYVKSFLEKCDLLYDGVMPAKLYNFGLSRNKWIDYMLSGRPMIVSYSGFESMINEANCGIVVPAGDIYALAEAIENLYKLKKEQLDEMGARGYEFVLKERNFKKLTLSYKNIFDNFL